MIGFQILPSFNRKYRDGGTWGCKGCNCDHEKLRTNGLVSSKINYKKKKMKEKSED